MSRAPAANLRERSLDEIVSAFDRDAIGRCSNASSCNLLCARVIGRSLRHPISGVRTLLQMRNG